MSKLVSAEPTLQQVKICYERIIPRYLDKERPVRQNLRMHMAAASEGKTLNAAEIAHVARMAVILSKRWDTDLIRCRFLDGSSKMRKKVEAISHEWEQYANIKLKFVNKAPEEIRISFYADQGSWSAVGRDAREQNYFPLHQPTMNYGWLRDDTEDKEYRRVVLHEFGHALGCIHEHQSPNFNRTWNKKAVMEYFQGPPNYWSPEDIDFNVLAKYSPEGIESTRYDQDSIMLYMFDGALFSDNLGPTNTNSELSQSDIDFIKTMYP